MASFLGKTFFFRSCRSLALCSSLGGGLCSAGALLGAKALADAALFSSGYSLHDVVHWWRLQRGRASERERERANRARERANRASVSASLEACFSFLEGSVSSGERSPPSLCLSPPCKRMDLRRTSTCDRPGGSAVFPFRLDDRPFPCHSPRPSPGAFGAAYGTSTSGQTCVAKGNGDSRHAREVIRGHRALCERDKRKKASGLSRRNPRREFETEQASSRATQNPSCVRSRPAVLCLSLARGLSPASGCGARFHNARFKLAPPPLRPYFGVKIDLFLSVKGGRRSRKTRGLHKTDPLPLSLRSP